MNGLLLWFGCGFIILLSLLMIDFIRNKKIKFDLSLISVIIFGPFSLILFIIFYFIFKYDFLKKEDKK